MGNRAETQIKMDKQLECKIAGIYKADADLRKNHHGVATIFRRRAIHAFLPQWKWLVLILYGAFMALGAGFVRCARI